MLESPTHDESCVPSLFSAFYTYQFYSLPSRDTSLSLPLRGRVQFANPGNTYDGGSSDEDSAAVPVPFALAPVRIRAHLYGVPLPRPESSQRMLECVLNHDGKFISENVCR